jgi:hypothetical protein
LLLQLRRLLLQVRLLLLQADCGSNGRAAVGS